jgi:RNA polymerase II subunit A C-terminal domain phosphatase SSU72
MAAAGSQGSSAVTDLSSRIKFAMVCASNMNRSMEAHSLLAKKGFNVRSYGTSTSVKLPGPSIDKPNVYNFGTPYRWISTDLNRKDPALYRANGVLNMLLRNASVKAAPERWHTERHHVFDVIIAFEDRVFDALVDHFMKREAETFHLVHVINFPVKDTHEEAAIGAQQVLKLCQMIENSEDWESRLTAVLEEFQKATGKKIVYMPAFY